MNIDQNQCRTSYQSWMNGTYQGYGKNRSVQSGFVKSESVESGFAENREVDLEEGQKTETKNEEPKSYREQILEKMEEMAQNIKNGTIQPKFQIGAQAYTIKEWEKLLEKFDAAEEVLQEEVRAQIEEAEKQAEKEALQNAATNDVSEDTKVTAVSASSAGQETAALLTDEITKCSYPTDDPGKKHWYITCYEQDGIFCKEAYFDGTRWVNKDLWSFSYTEEGQYEKVMAFLQRFPQDANLRFAAHENFWKDFLAGEIDEDDFTAFFATTKDGVPDYTYEKDGATYIDREKAKYAKYMNDFGAHFYTGEELELIQRAILQENKKRLGQKIKPDEFLTIPDDGGKQPGTAEDEIETQIVTKPDGSTVLQITTSYGVMELEIAQAQKFGLMLDLGQNDSRYRSGGVNQATAHGAMAGSLFS